MGYGYNSRSMSTMPLRKLFLLSVSFLTYVLMAKQTD